MRGTINWQIHEIYFKSGINQIGSSKHKAKEEIRSSLSTQNIKTNWHVMGKNIGIFSYRTADLYRDIWKQLGSFVRDNYKIKDLEKIEGQHVKAYLESKIEKGLAHNTFVQHAAALEKFETALNGYAKNTGSGNNYEFTSYIKETRSSAHNNLERFNGNRDYDNPKDLIDNIKNENHQLVAKIQLESGCRVSECTYLSEKNLMGFKQDPVTGEEKGVIYLEKTKGGKSGEKYMSVETYKLLEQKIKTNTEGRFQINNDNYRESLKKAAEKTDQKYTGTHGLRWNFAVERFNEVQGNGLLNDQEALYQVSKELFHERADITKHYLKK